jgi:AcrR family transcriptional regulator
MSSTQPAINPRQWLSARQTTTVIALLDAALEELRESDFEQLSIRGVAQRAGVAHTTAYSYFTSKNHLVAELHWRQLKKAPVPEVSSGDSLTDRVRSAFSGPALAMVNEPALAQAGLGAFVTNDPNVRRVRLAIAEELSSRLSVALGSWDEPVLHRALLTHYSGAMLAAGMLTQDYIDVIEQMEALARLVGRQ